MIVLPVTSTVLAPAGIATSPAPADRDDPVAADDDHSVVDDPAVGGRPW